MKLMNQTLFTGLKEIQLKKYNPIHWWEGGIMLSREIGEGLNIDAGIHSGMQIPDSGKVRSGRQKVGCGK